MTSTKVLNTKLSKNQHIELDRIRIKKIYDGDELEFAKLYQECKFLIGFYKSKYYGNSKVSVEDAYNEALFVCYSSIRSGKLGKERLLSCELKDYISVVMRNKLYDEAKKYGEETRMDEIEERDILNNEDRQEIMIRIIVSNFVQKITEPCKSIIEGFYLEEKSYKDLLNEMSNYKSIDALKTQSYKCKKKIEIELKKELNNHEIFI